ncbi:MAG: ribonuclease HII [SAR202 cluster bacterium]|nr:ribonuclease HII [SAR202 cluster bacterium]
MPSLDLELNLHKKGLSLVAGVDEVGRGPLAGPVMAGAVVLPTNLNPRSNWLALINDSKLLTRQQREKAADVIFRHALGIGIGRVEPWEIDDIGIAAASELAMTRAISNLPLKPQHVLIDYFSLKASRVPHTAVPGGDEGCVSIAAASIVAKVARDTIMTEFHSTYPAYGFHQHKGYGTAGHMEALRQIGPCRIHRRSFAPVRLAADALGMA